jgi:RNA polymerase-binding transcription factor DksA
MTEEQISKFRDILLNEKNQLSKLDKEYEGELTKLNEKHMIEWKEFETKEKRNALTQAEQATKTQEQVTEEDLLKRLSSA